MTAATPSQGDRSARSDDAVSPACRLAHPLTVGGLPEEGSILAITTDDRYATIHFRGRIKDQTEPTVFTYPFLGWAVQVTCVNVDSGIYFTALVPVGVHKSGVPVTAWDLVTYDDVEPGSMVVFGIEPRKPVSAAEPATPNEP